MAGITATGFEKLTLAEIKAEIELDYKAAFGQSINLRPPSLMATTIGIAAEREAKIWDLAEENYNARGRSTSVGVGLDNVGELSLDERIAAQPSKTFKQIFFGTVGTPIPTTFKAAVSNNALAIFTLSALVTLGAGVDEVQHLSFSQTPDAGTWAITLPDSQVTASLAYNANAAAIQAAIRLLSGWETVTVSGSYSGFVITFTGSSGLQPWGLVSATGSITHTSSPVTVTTSETTLGVAQGVGIMVADADGPTVADAGMLTSIITPITGLTSTKNLDDATLGRLVESDAEYRIRQEADLQKNSAATLEAIRISLKAVPDVTEAIVYENITLTTDGNSVPGKTIHAYVENGDEQAIANALWLAVGGGIATYGSITKTVIDSQGLNQTIKFSRPTEKPVYATIAISAGDAYPLNGDTLVLAAVLAYGVTLKIGDDVLIRSKLLPAIVDNVPGVTDLTIQIGFAPSPVGTANLTIAASERATFTSSNVLVSS